MRGKAVVPQHVPRAVREKPVDIVAPRVAVVSVIDVAVGVTSSGGGIAYTCEMRHP